MVVIENDLSVAPPRPRGYKVAARNRKDLRAAATDCIPLLKSHGCYCSDKGSHFLNTSYLLEDLLFQAGYTLHVLDDQELSETAAFTVPEQQLIVMRESIYDGLSADDPFARYTVVHEFSHIFLQHAVTLHRGSQAGDHQWWEDSEWQANNLTAEILMPVEVVKELDCKPILIQAACGVSARAVTFRLENLKKEGLI